MKEYDIVDGLSALGIRFDYDRKPRKVTGFASLDKATSSQLSFCYLHKKEEEIPAITRSKARVIICDSRLKGQVPSQHSKSLIFVSNPRLVFSQVVNYVNNQNRTPLISKSAIISKKAEISKTCYVGNLSIIGDDCHVGDFSVIHDNVSLVRNCWIGSNCTIHNGAVIGADGFSYERTKDYKLEKFPHFGGVKIGNNVEINANSNIARGSLSDTVIGDGTKVDALVHIAHNTVIGKDCLLAAGAIIGGSVTIGDCCWIGINSTIRQKLKIGNNVIVAAGACVISDVPDNDVVAGVPAKSIKEKVKSDLIFMMAGHE